MQGDGQLAGPEVGAEVPADLADRLDDQPAYLLGDLHQLVIRQALEVGGAVDAVDEAVGALGCHDVRV